MPLEIEYTRAFQKDYARELRGRYSKTVVQDLKKALAFLENEQLLPTGYKDHDAQGEWEDHRECHLKPNLLLVYQIVGSTLFLARLGSHTRIFKKL